MLRRMYHFQCHTKEPLGENGFKLVGEPYPVSQPGYTEESAKKALVVRLREQPVFVGDMIDADVILFDNEDYYISVGKGEGKLLMFKVARGQGALPYLRVPFDALFGQMAFAFDELHEYSNLTVT